MSYIGALTGLSALLSVLCTCLPVPSRAKCYEYTAEPSIFDEDCSPIGALVRFQCSVRIDVTSATKSPCEDYTIEWVHKPTNSSTRYVTNEETAYNIRESSCSINRSEKTSRLTISTLGRAQLGYYWCETFSDGGERENRLSPSPVSSRIGLVAEPCQQPVPACTSDVVLYEEAVETRCAIPGIEPTTNFPPICPINTTRSTAYINPNTNFLSIKTSAIAASTVANIHNDMTLKANHSANLTVSDSTILVFIYIQAGLVFFIVLMIIIGLLIGVCLRQRKKHRQGAAKNTETKKEMEVEMDMNSAYSTVTKFKCLETGVDSMAGDGEDTDDDPQSHIYSHITDCYPQTDIN